MPRDPNPVLAPFYNVIDRCENCPSAQLCEAEREKPDTTYGGPKMIGTVLIFGSSACIACVLLAALLWFLKIIP